MRGPQVAKQFKQLRRKLKFAAPLGLDWDSTQDRQGPVSDWGFLANLQRWNSLACSSSQPQRSRVLFTNAIRPKFNRASARGAAHLWPLKHPYITVQKYMYPASLGLSSLDRKRKPRQNTVILYGYTSIHQLLRPNSHTQLIHRHPLSRLALFQGFALRRPIHGGTCLNIRPHLSPLSVPALRPRGFKCS